jgi:hypothetical protein
VEGLVTAYNANAGGLPCPEAFSEPTSAGTVPTLELFGLLQIHPLWREAALLGSELAPDGYHVEHTESGGAKAISDPNEVWPGCNGGSPILAVEGAARNAARVVRETTGTIGFAPYPIAKEVGVGAAWLQVHPVGGSPNFVFPGGAGSGGPDP